MKRSHNRNTQHEREWQDTPDTYTEMANIPTNGGKTSIYVPEVGLFFIIHPKTTIDSSALLVYRVNR